MKQALLISHDIGGFRPAFAYLSKKYSILKCLLGGPALTEAFQNSIETIENIEQIEISKYVIYITTGWSSSFERSYMKFFNENNINWVGVLDHWTTYSDRFVLDGEKYLPKQLIVFDEYALKLCRSTFPNIECNVVPNFFDIEFVRSYNEFQPLHAVTPQFDIFFSDPISEHYGDSLGYDEFDQILYILNKKQSRYSKSFNLCIRPHPSEKAEKYFKFLNENNITNTFVSQNSILEDMYNADLVYGASSYAMHLASLVEKKIICSIPIKNVKSSLPHASLQYLRDMNV